MQGGISNGELIVLRVAFKPTATIARTQRTVSRAGQDVELLARGRHDPCVVPRSDGVWRPGVGHWIPGGETPATLLALTFGSKYFAISGLLPWSRLWLHWCVCYSRNNYKLHWPVTCCHSNY